MEDTVMVVAMGTVMEVTGMAAETVIVMVVVMVTAMEVVMDVATTDAQRLLNLLKPAAMEDVMDTVMAAVTVIVMVVTAMEAVMDTAMVAVMDTAMAVAAGNCSKAVTWLIDLRSYFLRLRAQKNLSLRVHLV
jgi:hypothetical protein